MIFNADRPGIERPVLFCSPPAHIYMQPALFYSPPGCPDVQPASPLCCAACQPALYSIPLACSVVQPDLMRSTPARPLLQPARDEHGSALDRIGSGVKPILAGSGLDRTAILLKIGGSGLDRTDKFVVLM